MGKLISKPDCPHCKEILDGFTDPSGKNVPKPGDISICAYCAEVLEFDSEMKLIPIREETVKFVDLLEIQKAQQIVRDIIILREEKKNAKSTGTTKLLD